MDKVPEVVTFEPALFNQLHFKLEILSATFLDFGIKFHFYADDTQLYKAVNTTEH